MKLIASRRQNSTAFYPAVLGEITGEDVPATRTSIKTIEIEGININDLPNSFADSKAFEALGLVESPALVLGLDSLALFDRVEIAFPSTEERRVGNECVSPWRYRWAASH